MVHRIVQRAAASAQCFRDLPITFPLTNRRVFERVIDLASVDDGSWYVIDFKTDENLRGSGGVTTGSCAGIYMR
jgi:ATP-dependent exoDNAse (exonuclease V) beta subunit